MQEARDNVLGICGQIYAGASKKLGLDFDIVFVIYVGIGCGAGWAATYDGQPAVLLGLENVAEEKWHAKSKLKGLTSHEVGHLVHMKWRTEWETSEKNEEDPMFRLYSEGFAGKCEHLILGKETWHMAKAKKWLSWCQQHGSWLAKEFLERLERASVKDFFGSWFDIQGKSQTGYLLGHGFIRELEKSYSLKEIALLNVEKVKKLCEQYLVSLADRTAG